MGVKFPRVSPALLVLLLAYGVAILIVMMRPGAALSGDTRKVIRIAHWQIEAGPREGVDAMIKRYEELNPDVRVEQVAVPGGIYKQWMRTQLIGGTAPDIIEFGRLFNANDIPPRYFEPISEYVEQPNPYNRGTPLEGERWRDTFLDGLNTPDTYLENLGNFYGITLCQLSTRLFFNPELLRQITGSTQPPDTYEGMRALAEKLARYNDTSASARVSLYAGSDFNGTILMDRMLSRATLGLNLHHDRLREQGAQARDEAVNYLRGDWDYRRPEMLSGLKMMREITQNLRPGFQQLERDAAMQEFLRGQALMIITGTWDATSLTSLAPFKVGVTKFPWPTMADGPDGRYYWTPVSEPSNTSMPLCLSKTSAHKEQAIDFLQFITSVEGNGIFYRKSGWLPSNRGVVVSEDARVYLPRLTGYPVRTSYKGGFGSESLELWQRQLYHLISPQGSVEEFLDAFEAKLPGVMRSDLQMKTRDLTVSLRHDLPALTSLAMLERLRGGDARQTALRQGRESSQNINEARLYEALAVLEKGAAINEPEAKPIP